MNQHSRDVYSVAHAGGGGKGVRRAGEMMLFILLFKEMHLKFDNLTT